MQISMDGLDLGALLLNIHDFFLGLGVDEIRKRSSNDDKPLRMVKTILHELCKMRGYDIYDDASAIPGRDSDPQPIIFAYISLNLQSLLENGHIRAPAGGEGSLEGHGVTCADSGADSFGSRVFRHDSAYLPHPLLLTECAPLPPS
jgi:hypothetical protein